MFFVNSLTLVLAAVVPPAAASRAPFINKDSNPIVKYAAWSVTKHELGDWVPVEISGRNLSDCDAFRQGKSPTHYICDTDDRTTLSDMTLNGCRSACNLDSSCSVVQWQGKRENGFRSNQLGQCFHAKSCDSAKEYSSSISQDFCMDIAHLERPVDGTWTPVIVSGRSVSNCDAFRRGESPTHYICDGDRSKLPDATLEACHHACIQDYSCFVVQWQGKRENGFSAQQLGECYALGTCDSVHVYSTSKSQNFCLDIARVTRAKGPDVAIGQVTKHPSNPLMVQDKPWDARWDNAYPNVEYSPGADGGDYKVWYGGFITCSGCDHGSGSNRVNAWHYANSSDGLSWDKPNIGIVDLAKISHATYEMKSAGTQNNVLMTSSDGMGIYRDDFDSNASRLYKAIGTGCYGEGGNTGCTSGTGVSVDGKHWTDSTHIDWPSPQRWDDHQNLFFDEVLGRFVATTRDGFGGNPGRTIAIALGSEDGSFGGWASPELTLAGNEDHQLYSQVTFRYYNIYLGIVMVFNTKDPATVGTVQCRLAWSPSIQSGWQWVSSSGLTGEEIIPIDGAGSGAFDSNICFASKPIVVGDAVHLYYMGGNGPHNGPRNTSLALATLRMDGFAGLRAGADPIVVETVPLSAAGSTLLVTADVFSGGSVCLGVLGEVDISVEDCVPITRNVTNLPVQFKGGKTLAGLVGSDVTLQIALKNAMVYTFGFEKAEFLV